MEKKRKEDNTKNVLFAMNFMFITLLHWGRQVIQFFLL